MENKMINKFNEGDFFGSSSSPEGGYNPPPYSEAPRWDDFSLLDESMAKKRFSKFSLAIFVYMVVSFVLIIAMQVAITFIFDEAKAEEILGNYTVLMIANFVAMYVIAFPILYLMVRGMRSVRRTKTPMKISEFFQIFLVAEAFMYAGNLVGSYLNMFIGGIFGVEIDNGVAEMIENTPMWLIIAMVVLVGPVVEELIFRKLFFDKLGHYGDRLIIFVSAIAFGIFHGNFYQLFYAVLVGLVLGYVYARTSNILYPIALHVMLNFLGSVIPMLLYDKIERFGELSEIMMSGGEVDPMELGQLSLIVGAYSIVELAMVVAGTVIFFKKKNTIFVSDRCEVLIPKQRRVAVILGNVGAILFVALMAIMMASEIVLPIIEALNTPTLPTEPPATDIAPGGNTDVGDALIWLIKSIAR